VPRAWPQELLMGAVWLAGLSLICAKLHSCSAAQGILIGAGGLSLSLNEETELHFRCRAPMQSF
jgi:hypothetical protein